MTETTTWMMFLEEIKSELESQGVVSVKRVTKKRNDLIELTNTYLLAFGMPTLPTNNKVGLVTAKIHVEAVKLASGVMNSGMTAKAAKTIRCAKSVKVHDDQKFSNVKQKEKLHSKRQREWSTYILYRNQIYHLILQL